MTEKEIERERERERKGEEKACLYNVWEGEGKMQRKTRVRAKTGFSCCTVNF